MQFSLTASVPPIFISSDLEKLFQSKEKTGFAFLNADETNRSV